MLGAGGHASVLVEILNDHGLHVTGYVLDENFPIPANDERRLIHSESFLANFKPGSVELINAIGTVGSTSIKERVIEKYESKGYVFRQVISRYAKLSPSAVLSRGVQVLDGAVVNANADIGAHVVVNTSAVIEHDTVIGDYVHVAPGAVICGNSIIGDRSHIGANATIIQGINVGSSSIVGAGAVVTVSFGEKQIARGVPARFWSIE